MPKDSKRATRPDCEKQSGPDSHGRAHSPSHPEKTQSARRMHQRRERLKQILKATKSRSRRDQDSSSTASSDSGSSPRTCPSDGSFFASASNIGIEGGHFSVDSSTSQNKTNLTINLFHGPPKECVNAYTGSFNSSGAPTSRGASASPISSFHPRDPWPDHGVSDKYESVFSTGHYFNTSDAQSLNKARGNSRLDSLQPQERRSHTADGSLCPDNLDECANDSDRTAVDNDIKVKGVPSSTPLDVMAIQRARHDSEFQESSEIYYRHLSVKKRGYPLWLPEPNYYLPMEYQRKGTSVGDVGMLTTDGGFDYLFNVLLSHDHPFNVGRVPPDFAPLFPALDSGDIRAQLVFRSNSFIASPRVKRSFESAGDCRTNFYISGSEGAILVTPDGAVSEDLSNLSRIRQYMSENIKSWYHYANGPRGRELANGDLRLVIGCDKTSAWGMAASAKQSQDEDTVTHLCFKSVGHCGDAKTYGWELHSGTAEVRSGPDMREIQALNPGDTSCTVNYENQCIFVRTLNATLNSAEWLELMAQIKVSGGSETHTPLQGRPNQTHCQDRVASRELGGFAGVNVNNDPSPFTDETTNCPTRRVHGEVPVYLVSHPSRFLNEFILQRMEDMNAKMVITDDSDWGSVLTEDEIVMPTLRDLTDRIFASNTPTQDAQGIVHLERNVETSSVQRPQPSLPTLTPFRTELDDLPIFGDEVRAPNFFTRRPQAWGAVYHHPKRSPIGNGLLIDESVSRGVSHASNTRSISDDIDTGGAGVPKTGPSSAEQRLEPNEAKRAKTTNKYREKTLAPVAGGKCRACNARETPVWRRGPDGPKTLCNACGLHYAKRLRKRAKEVGHKTSLLDLEELQASIWDRAADDSRRKSPFVTHSNSR